MTYLSQTVSLFIILLQLLIITPVLQQPKHGKFQSFMYRIKQLLRDGGKNWPGLGIPPTAFIQNWSKAFFYDKAFSKCSRQGVHNTGMKEVSKGQYILLESASNCNVDFRMSLIGFSVPKVLKTITSNDFKELKYSPESPRLLKNQEI